MILQKLLDDSGAFRVKAHHGLINNDQRAVQHEGGGHDDLLPHAVGIALNKMMLPVQQVEELQIMLCPAELFFRQTVKAGNKLEKLIAGQFLVKIGPVRYIGSEFLACRRIESHIMTADGNDPAFRLEQSGKHFYGGCFACAVGAEKTKISPPLTEKLTSSTAV